MKNTPDIRLTSEERESDRAVVFGFWAYLMTDLVLFASLFAVYAVLRANTAGGPSGSELFSGSFVLTETLLLLTSSFTCGLALLGVRSGSMRRVLVPLLVTIALGALFLVLEFSEFYTFIADGHSWQQSGFLSSYFALVGTHGLHILIGLVWAGALAIAIALRGLTRSNMRKLLLWSMFWHFLDLVWILIFTMVYLLSIR